MSGGIMIRNRYARKALVATSSLLAVASLGGTAYAASSLSFTGDGVLVAKGTAVNITAAYSCPVDTVYATLTVSLNQRVNGGRVVLGVTSATNLVCDDTIHLVSFLLQPQAGSAFKPGEALAHGQFQVCDPSSACPILDLVSTIRVRSK